MQLMSIEDLAVYLGDSKRTIYKYIASGDCPPYIKISSKNIKFDRADVDAWLESKRVEVRKQDGKRKLPFMPRAKKAIETAEKEARKQGLDYVGTEHLLVGFLSDEEAIAAIVLKNLQMDTTRFKQLYEQTCQKKKANEYLKNTARMAIRCAHDISITLGHEYIGTEHLLLSIFSITGSEGYRILHELGISYERVLGELKNLVVCKNGK